MSAVVLSMGPMLGSIDARESSSPSPPAPLPHLPPCAVATSCSSARVLASLYG